MFNTIGWLAITAANLFIAWLAWRTNRIAHRNEVTLQIIHTATNSMKDALVASTAKASYAEGHDDASAEAAKAMITAKAVDRVATVEEK
jgi:hypothetical protein